MSLPQTYRHRSDTIATDTTSRSDTSLTSALAIVPEQSAVSKSSQRGLGAGSPFTSRPLQMYTGGIVHPPPLATPPRMTGPRREPLQGLDRGPKAFGPSSRHGTNAMSDVPYSGQQARQAYSSHGAKVTQGANSTYRPSQLSHRSSRPTSRDRNKDLPILPRLRRRHTSSKPPSISALQPLTVPSGTPVPFATPDPVKEMYARDESASSRERWLRTRPVPQLESEREVRPQPRMRHSMSVSGVESDLRQTVERPDLPSGPQEDRQMFQDGRRGLHSSVTQGGPAESLSSQSPRSFLSGPRYDHPAPVGTTLSFPENWPALLRITTMAMRVTQKSILRPDPRTFLDRRNLQLYRSHTITLLTHTLIPPTYVNSLSSPPRCHEPEDIALLT